MNLQEFKQSVDELHLGLARETSSDLKDHLNDLVLSGGKKFRPGLLFLMGRVLGLESQGLTVYARAVELTHLASLVHDDVIDAADTRRNYPTLNSQKNNTTAILGGDFLLASVMGELATMNRNDILIDLTASIQDLADGEWLQYNLKRKPRVTLADLDEISVKKTGSLIRWCCTTPAKLAGHDDISTMATLGERIGVMFQMADDIVDGLTTSGKPAFLDILNGQINFVTLKLCELYPELTEAVYDLKGTVNGSVPWGQDQYKRAMLAVDEMINYEKDKILSILHDLCQKKNAADYYAVFELMISKIQAPYIDAI